jgi:hypothetical protein
MIRRLLVRLFGRRKCPGPRPGFRQDGWAKRKNEPPTA